MSVVNNNLLLTADAGVAPSAYQISRSLRFNSADTAYLNRTPSVAGNRKTWTWAAWVKRSALGGDQMLFSTGAFGHTTCSVIFFRDDAFVYSSLVADILRTTAVYRDLSAWYHFTVLFDSTQATASSRLRFFVNGSEVTQFTTDVRSSQISQNTDYGFNLNQSHVLGRFTFDNSRYFSGYLADVHFIDGQALTPSSFTETNATTGQLVPKAYSGTYGTNGFRLNFSDNSASTFYTLGADSRTDGALNGNDGTLVNGPTYSSANGGSIVFDGTNDYVDNTFSFSSRPFSINIWVYFNSLTGWQTFVGQDTSQATAYGLLYFQKTSNSGTSPRPANTFNAAILTSSNTLIDCLDTSAVIANTWYNFCCSVSATDIKLYRNGSLVQTTVNSDALATPTGTIKVGTGYFNNGLADYANARIPQLSIYNKALSASEVTQNYNALVGRFGGTSTGSIVTDGMVLNLDAGNTASYPGTGTTWTDISLRKNNWTPNNLSVNAGGQVSISAASGALPVYNTTDAYGAVKGTGTRTDSNSSSLVLAIPMDGANNGTTFTDESPTIKGSGTAKAITRNGDTKTLTAQSKFYGSSGFFDGTGDYLTCASSADFNIGTGDYTFETWIYKTSSDRLVLLAIAGAGLSIAINTSGNIEVCRSLTAIDFTFTASVQNNTWTHVAVTRFGTSLRAFKDGVLLSTQTSPTSYGQGICYIGIDANASTTPFVGYIQDLRIYKGVAKYTSNFTPPSATQNTTVAAGCDSLTDTPTSYGTDTGAGGEVRGNYATLNPLDNGGITLANGNLDASRNTSGWVTTRSTIGMSSGKWYWECTMTVALAANCGLMLGIGTSSVALANYPGASSTGYAYNAQDGQKYNNVSGSAYGATYTANDVIGIAFDADAGTLTFYKNNTSQGVAFSGLLSGSYFPLIGIALTSAGVFNFGQRPFAYAAPSGFKALCDTNLPTPTIAKGSSVFDTLLWIGNGAVRSITGLNYSPDLVWIKGRSRVSNSFLFDTVRGATNRICPSLTIAEASEPNTLTSFNSDGFNLGTDAGVGACNLSGDTWVGWAWDAGSSTVTNTAGSITSQVRANASAGFSVVTATSNGANPFTVGHGLGVTPAMYIFKNRDLVDDWYTWHQSLSSNTSSILRLNTTASEASSTAVWGNGATSTTIGLRASSVALNGQKIVLYCFAPVTGYSSFGSYTGNGSADGPFVYLGFRPAFLMMKRTNSTGNWVMLDSKREGYNVDNDPLYANLTNVEGTDDLVDITSNGFKLRTTNADCNASGGTYIYAAFAENPFQFARAR